MRKLHLWILVLISSAGVLALEDAKYSALYVFSDSLLDPGNNIYFADTLAKANFLPYGIDFSSGPTGRLCNGKIIADFIAEQLGLPILPSHANVVVKGASILSGVNYASAAAGILNDTGYLFGRIIPLAGQIRNFKGTLEQLKLVMDEDEVSKYLSRALVMMDIGSNDYVNNYMLPQYYRSSHFYTLPQFGDLLIKLYRQAILEIQDLGIRKFFIFEAYPIGCVPLKLKNGECDVTTNNIIAMFNSKLRSMISGLTSDYPESAFMSANSFKLFFQIRDNFEAYGFKVRDKACCGSSGDGTTYPRCFRNSEYCWNRREYMFWDSAHPTEATNRIIAQIIHNTTSWL